MDLHKLDGLDVEALLENGTPEQIIAVRRYIEACESYKKYNKVEFYKPQSWQERAMQLGNTEAVRAVIAANR